MTSESPVGAPAGTGRIRLFVCDIDGCLTKGSCNPLPLKMIQRLYECNSRSKTDPDFPAISLCTGRTQPYIECLMQAYDAHLPATCENGTVIFEPTRYEIHLHPEFTDQEKQVMAQMRTLIDEHLIGPDVQHEPGKFTHFTLVVSPPTRPADLMPAAESLAAQFPGWWRVEPTKSCVHFLFQHLHKGTGVEWLADMTGIGLHEMAGVGDARPDIPFLQQVAIACAPGNAHPDVMAVSHWTSQLDDSDAVIEFMDRIVEHNRAITRAEVLGSPRPAGVPTPVPETLEGDRVAATDPVTLEEGPSAEEKP